MFGKVSDIAAAKTVKLAAILLQQKKKTVKLAATVKNGKVGSNFTAANLTVFAAAKLLPTFPFFAAAKLMLTLPT